jgi:hypothetical protein
LGNELSAATAPAPQNRACHEAGMKIRDKTVTRFKLARFMLEGCASGTDNPFFRQWRPISE